MLHEWYVTIHNFIILKLLHNVMHVILVQCSCLGTPFLSFEAVVQHDTNFIFI